MEYLIGPLLALAIGAFATAAGFDRERAFYPVVMIVIASYYVLFAILSGSLSALALEIWVLCGFGAVAVAGFKRNLWLVVAALLGHAAFDLIHPDLFASTGAPRWWPMFCLTFDVTAAFCLAARLMPANRPAVEAELQAAKACEDRGCSREAFHHLERAHVLGQTSTLEHVRVHMRMLRWSLRWRDLREARGQVLRIVGAASKTAFGLVPVGNTGGANVSPFRSLPVPRDLAALGLSTPRLGLRALLAAALLAGATFGAGGSAAAPRDVRTAEVDGRTVSYRVLGQGRPALVLISGLGDGMATFDHVAIELAKTATVIVYDRAGYGGSQAAATPRDAATVDRELSGLLKASGVAAPYVIGGHSIGGLYAEFFAANHQSDVAGLILVDSRPADFTARCEAAKLKMCVVPPSMVRFLPKAAQAELGGLDGTISQVARIKPRAGMPVLVMSRSIGRRAAPLDALWATAQEDLAGRYAGARHMTAPAGGHYIHRDERGWFVSNVLAFLASIP
ncbi:alpha/beta fold hydrolase [Phenylobacterium sp.]|uniref:alpha/beta fold hydrolase n=1 Tax=Phenylobacterium sp. TaxID=1871053 RepID=UPI00286B75FB|nr:alpha/beta fold hydrolase [Phenylobacterium sp.]